MYSVSKTPAFKQLNIGLSAFQTTIAHALLFLIVAPKAWTCFAVCFVNGKTQVNMLVHDYCNQIGFVCLFVCVFVFVFVWFVFSHFQQIAHVCFNRCYHCCNQMHMFLLYHHLNGIRTCFLIVAPKQCTCCFIFISNNSSCLCLFDNGANTMGMLLSPFQKYKKQKFGAFVSLVLFYQYFKTRYTFLFALE